MPLLRPSLTLILDMDERLASTDTVLEIKRCYTYIGSPVIRTHAPAQADEPVQNTARMLVGLGTRKYLHSSDEGADELWDTVVEQWIGNMLRKIGTTMRAFNTRQRKIGLPEVIFQHFDIELQGGAFIVSLHTDPQSFVSEDLRAQVASARSLLNDGTLGDAVRVSMPSDAAYGAQESAAYEAWLAEHPEPEPEPDDASAAADEAAEAAEERELTREEWLEQDKIAKSYENTAVPPTDSDLLPAIEREEEVEPERFSFEVDYTRWEVHLADGSTRLFDSAACAFVDEDTQ